jgi:astacin (peptidase family M12A)
VNDGRLVRGLCRLALGAFFAGASSCQSSAQRAPAYAPPPPAPAVVVGTDASSTVEAYGPPQVQRQLGSAALFLPGAAGQRQVNFATVNGQAVLDGDIMLGPATTLLFRYGIPWQSTLERKSAVAVASRSYLWPDGEIPYMIDASAEDKRQLILNGMRAFEGTPIKLRPRTAADRDYVVFRKVGEGCWSYLGKQGGAQDVDVTTCASGNVAHELMHCAGFYHEQSRGDRDDYITIVWDEIAPEMVSNFDKRDARGQDIGAYDYGSIMHYSAYAGSRTGKPTIIPRQPGARIGQRDGLSPLDRAAIDTLYGKAGSTSAPPVASLPPAPTALPPAPTSLPPVALPPVATTPPASVPTPTPGAAPASNASFSGNYRSARGDVSCSQGGLFVQCQYPGGNLFCAVSGPELACTWNGGGQGRATFQRQASGVLAGTWGDGFSTNSRGQWDLTPLPGKSASVTPAAVPPAPSATSTPAAPASGAGALSGNFTSTRGNMSCAENGSSVSCNFQEADGVGGRLDCAKSQNGLELSCAWITYFPRPATGRASFTRASPGDRRLAGTWGLFLANTGGGRWDAQGL